MSRLIKDIIGLGYSRSQAYQSLVEKIDRNGFKEALAKCVLDTSQEHKDRALALEVLSSYHDPIPYVMVVCRMIQNVDDSLLFTIIASIPKAKLPPIIWSILQSIIDKAVGMTEEPFIKQAWYDHQKWRHTVE